MNLEGKRVLVIGLGKTGEALCDFLLGKNARVKVSEIRRAEELGSLLDRWKDRGLDIETGQHSREFILNTDMIVKSPGVHDFPEMNEARERGIPVISEVELASHFLQGKIIGVTGSNGKSTTVSLIHKILHDGGLDTHLAGNIGTPLVCFANNSRADDIYVTELSSFQLESISRFRAFISVILNITPDHLDWHDSFEEYARAKRSLLSNQDETDIAILNRDDERVWPWREKTQARVFGFSREHKIIPGSYLKKGWILVAHPDEQRLIRPEEIPLHGIHNQENVMAAALAGSLLGLPLSRISESIRSFKGLEHRLEKVDSIDGVDFFNDSKATNVDATLKSITSFKNKVIVILGGRDKGGNFEKLKRPLRKHARKAILIGEAAEKIAKSLGNSIPLERAYSMEEAVTMGLRASRAGDVVLLAPACTSFDMYQNFEERGDIFKKEVQRLRKKKVRT